MADAKGSRSPTTATPPTTSSSSSAARIAVSASPVTSPVHTSPSSLAAAARTDLVSPKPKEPGSLQSPTGVPAPLASMSALARQQFHYYTGQLIQHMSHPGARDASFNPLSSLTDSDLKETHRLSLLPPPPPPPGFPPLLRDVVCSVAGSVTGTPSTQDSTNFKTPATLTSAPPSRSAVKVPSQAASVTSAGPGSVTVLPCTSQVSVRSPPATNEAPTSGDDGFPSTSADIPSHRGRSLSSTRGPYADISSHRGRSLISTDISSRRGRSLIGNSASSKPPKGRSLSAVGKGKKPDSLMRATAREASPSSEPADTGSGLGVPHQTSAPSVGELNATELLKLAAQLTAGQARPAPPTALAGHLDPDEHTPTTDWWATEQGAFASLNSLWASLAQSGSNRLPFQGPVQSFWPIPGPYAANPVPQGALWSQTAARPASAAGDDLPMHDAALHVAGSAASAGDTPMSHATLPRTYSVSPQTQVPLRVPAGTSARPHESDLVSSDEDEPVQDSDNDSLAPVESLQANEDEHQPTETASGQLTLAECLKLTKELFPKRIVNQSQGVPSAPSEFGWEDAASEECLAPVEHASLAQFLSEALPRPADDTLIDVKTWGVGKLLPFPKNPLRTKKSKPSQVPGSCLPPSTVPITHGDWKVLNKAHRQKVQPKKLWTSLAHGAALTLEDTARKGLEAVSHADALILTAKEAVIQPGTRNTVFREDYSPQQVASILSWAWQAVKTSGTYLASLYANAILLRRDTLLTNANSRVEQAEIARFRTLPLSTSSLFGDRLKTLLEQRSQEEKELAFHKVALGQSFSSSSRPRKRQAKGQPTTQPPKLQRFDTPTPTYTSYRGRGQSAASRGGSFRGRARGRSTQARGKGAQRSAGHPQ